MREIALFADTWIQRLCVIALAIAAGFIGIVALIGAADIFGTSILKNPVPSALEFSEAGLAIIVFMGLAQAQRRRGHITVDIISGQFKGWMAKASLGLALISAIAFFGFLAWRGYLAAYESFAIDERSMGQSSFPIWPGKILLCAGCVIAALESLRQFIRLLLGLENAEQQPGAHP
ncbi:MAG: TRAP transporter small permease [Rhodospirillales bacterium]|jgi:TRAP-type C4-dicarboxylate transport system permease small subunit